MMLPSDSFITRVGSSAPRLRSISSRDQRPSTAARAIGRRQRPRHLGGADVIGDMGLEQGAAQAQACHSPAGSGVGGMVAQEQQRACRRARAGSASKGASSHARLVISGTAPFGKHALDAGRPARHQMRARCVACRSCALVAGAGRGSGRDAGPGRLQCLQQERPAGAGGAGPFRRHQLDQPGLVDHRAQDLRRLLTGPLEARYYYLYATDGAGGTWEGKTHFCVAPAAKFLAPGAPIAPGAASTGAAFSKSIPATIADWTQTLSN